MRRARCRRAVATLNLRLVAAELRVAIEDASPRVTLRRRGFGVAGARSEPDMPIVEFGPRYEALLAAAPHAVALPTIAEWDAWTCYTSGTTGKPKGVVLSHRSRLLVGLICAAEFGCFGPDDRFLAMSPMSHGAGLGLPVGVLAAGGAIALRCRRGRKRWSRSSIPLQRLLEPAEATAAAARDGWVSGGDLARRDGDGYLYIVDRKKDMVISGRINVYPRETTLDPRGLMEFGVLGS